MMLKFSVKLVALNCVESFAYMYPEKGHTHGPLGATFGQTCVNLSLEEFEDDMDVVDILDHALKTSGLDVGSREGAKAYKLGESVEWVKWVEEVDLAMCLP